MDTDESKPGIADRLRMRPWCFYPAPRSAADVTDRPPHDALASLIDTLAGIVADDYLREIAANDAGHRDERSNPPLPASRDAA